MVKEQQNKNLEAELTDKIESKFILLVYLVNLVLSYFIIIL